MKKYVYNIKNNFLFLFSVFSVSVHLLYHKCCWSPLCIIYNFFAETLNETLTVKKEVGGFMTCRQASKQASEYPRKLFNTWLNCSQVKWWWNRQAVNFLNGSRCWEFNSVSLWFHRRMLGIVCWGCRRSCRCACLQYKDTLCICMSVWFIPSYS